MEEGNGLKREEKERVVFEKGGKNEKEKESSMEEGSKGDGGERTSQRRKKGEKGIK